MAKINVVRFAPEPSGTLHIGHLRPILLNEKLAKKGKYILRNNSKNG
jgi:glutamyl/glutaminyl-tRNA synthetase